MKRTKPIPKRRSKPRRGRVIDKPYLDFIAHCPPLVAGEGPITVHHVRRFGELKDDRRTIPLPASLHMKTHAKKGIPCIEDGKRVFEAFHHVDIEAAILGYRLLYAVVGRLAEGIAEQMVAEFRKKAAI